jgi:hypothetical protein
MWDAFSKQTALTPYQARPNAVDLNQKNTAYNKDSRKSEEFNWTQPDRIPDNALSKIIWRAVRGEKSVMPAPRRSAFIRVIDDGEEEGEEESGDDE